MKSLLTSLSIILLTSCLLSACAISQAADKDSSANITSANVSSFDQKSVPIDWERANADAKDSAVANSSLKLQRNVSTVSAVPLLLPPESITLSDSIPSVQQLAAAKMVTDRRGYSAVVRGETFTILIDASNQTFVTDEQTGTTLQTNFDGDYQPITNGGQITIGRYGALYAIQLLCSKEVLKNCITERMVREVIESLSVIRSEQQ